MRALLFAGGATLIAACSIGALDGFSGQEVPDGGGGDATITDSPSSAPDVVQPGDSSTEGSPTTSAYHLAVKADGPIAHFALEETSGAACASRTATSAVCVYPSDKLTRGQPGIGGTKAIRLDANTSTLSISGLPGDLSAPYTFELWVRLDVVAATTALGVFMNATTGNGDGFNLFLWDAAQVRTEVWKGGVLIAYGVAPSAMAPAVWHQIAVVHSPNPHADLLYVDAQLVEHNTDVNAARPMVTNPFKVSGFVGFVDEIAVYDKALPAERIAAHYAAQ